MNIDSTRRPALSHTHHARHAYHRQTEPQPIEGADRRRSDTADGFDSAQRSPMRALRKELRQLLKFLQLLAQQQQPSTSTPLPDPRQPDTFTPGSTGTSGPSPTDSSGGGGSAVNPFANGWPPANYGPGWAHANPDANLTWAQLSKLFTEGKVGPFLGGSCGFSNDQKLQALRTFWDQSVKSGKSPAECGFNVLCNSNTAPAGFHFGQ